MTDNRIHALDVRGLQALLAAREVTAVEVAEAFLRRISDLDAGGPHLNSVIEINPEALDIAARLDREGSDASQASTSRRSRSPQGQHRYGGPNADDRRFTGARGRSRS